MSAFSFAHSLLRPIETLRFHVTQEISKLGYSEYIQRVLHFFRHLTFLRAREMIKGSDFYKVTLASTGQPDLAQCTAVQSGIKSGPDHTGAIL